MKKTDTQRTFAIAITCFFFIVYSTYSLLKFYSLDASAWDLGIQTQIMQSAISGKLFYTNLLGMSFLEEHFSPFVFLLSFFFRIYPSPLTLLIMQAAATAFAGFILYLIGVSLVKNISILQKQRNSLMILVFLILVAYFLSPLTFSTIYFDFHLMAFLPLFYFTAIYTFLQSRYVLNAISIALIISLHSHFIFIAFFIIIIEFYMISKHRFNPFKDFFRFSNIKQNKRLYTTVVLTFIGLWGYLVFAAFLKSYIAGAPLVSFDPSNGQTSGVSSSPVALIVGLFKDPNLTLSYLYGNWGLKLEFLLIAFGTTGFFAFLAPEMLLPIIPFLLYAMFSNYDSYYSLGYQYETMIMPMIFIATLFSIKRVYSILNSSERESGKVKVKKGFLASGLNSNYKKLIKPFTSIFVIILLIGVSAGFLFDPIAPQPLFIPSGAYEYYHYPKISNSTQYIIKLESQIPHNSYLITQNEGIFPFFANDPNAYSTPWSPGVNISNINQFQYVIGYYGNSWVYTTNGNEPSINEIIKQDLLSGHFEVYAEGSNVLAISKNYLGLPIFYSPLVLHLSDFSTQVVKNNPVNSNNTSIICSNAFTLFPGQYSINFTATVYSSYSNNSTFSYGISNGTGPISFFKAPLNAQHISHNTAIYNFTINQQFPSNVQFYLMYNSKLNIQINLVNIMETKA